MSTDGKNKINKNALAAAISILIMLSPLAYSLARYVFAQHPASPQPFLERPAAQYVNCVRETTYMRFHHWELLKRIREEVVRDGIRGETTLAGCRECHPNRDRFCNQCHAAVNLKPDCFGCHYYPDSPDVASDEAHSSAIGMDHGRTDTEPDRVHGG